ncbi:DUF222 domain-containing protein [Microbacterium sp.]|uniref:HNH endonuclease signature motif containing protein n=1 Tax=Microbacterium sp. TaxID=51671 RepID=UPI0039E57663
MDEASSEGTLWRELDALVESLLAVRYEVAAAQARESELLAAAVGLIEQRTAERRARGVVFGNDLPVREVSAELGAAMRVADRTVQRRIDDAYTLVTRFPATFSAWRSGRIEKAHAAAIVDEGAFLADDAVRGEYEALVVAVAEVESAGRLRPIARAIAARLDPEGAAEQRDDAQKDRGTRVYDLGAGLGRLIADLPLHLAHAIQDRLTRQAELIHDAITDASAATADPSDTGAHDDTEGLADARTLDQLRADVLADVLLTGSPTAYAADENLAGLHAIQGHIRVTIPVECLAGTSAEPAIADGIGAVSPGLARRLAATAPGWDRILTDLPSGVPVAVDRYRPSAELHRFVAARDEHCRFPGCRRPAERCDVDHTIDAAKGGPTSACNLGEFCRRHHTLKHSTPWTVEQLPGGRFRWTSPTGRSYTDHPPATLRFVPERT